MSAIQQLLTEHIDIWTAADAEKKSGRGRSSGNAASVYGIKKLRELILELAVRGKLVPQDSKDEPASALLKRIQAEKAKLIADGKIKKDKPLAAISADEKPFDLPQGWKWTTLASISLVNPRNSAEDNSPASFVPMTMIGTRFNSIHDQEARLWKEIKQGFTHFAEGDIGVAKITPCFENSKACVFSGLLSRVGAGTTELHIVRPLNATLVPRFVLAYLKSPQFLLVGETRMTGTAGQKRLPKEFVESNLFPLPPLAEQHRIVAKVDELMALCDQLETQHSNAAEAHEKLVSHLLGTLKSPLPPLLQRGGGEAGGDSDWQRIAAHFDTLFTTEASIDALKQTVLQLAVMGKLVPQDANDEPASELLKRIQAEKDKLIAEGKLKKSKPLPSVKEDEKPVDLPRGWVCSYLADLVNVLNGRAYKQEELLASGTPVLRVGNLFTSEHWYYSDLTLDDDKYCNPGDLLFAWSASFGPFIWDGEKSIYHYHIWKLDMYGGELLHKLYLYNFLREQTQKIKAAGHGVMMIHMTKEKMEKLVVPIPPLTEQHRIVAKVDELMALCDQLKARITQANQLQQKLADVLVEQAVA